MMGSTWVSLLFLATIGDSEESLLKKVQEIIDRDAAKRLGLENSAWSAAVPLIWREPLVFQFKNFGN